MGEMGQPCLIPLSIEHLGEVPCGYKTVLLVSKSINTFDKICKILP